MDGVRPYFDSLSLRSVAIWCVPSHFLYQSDLRCRAIKRRFLPSHPTVETLPACIFMALKFYSMRADHWIVFDPPPKRFCQSFLDFDLLSDVHFCMDISPITAHNAYLGAKVDFCLLSLLPCPPLFYELTDSNHSFNSYFNKSFRTKSYEEQFSIEVKTDSRTILYLGLDFVSNSD